MEAQYFGRNKVRYRTFDFRILETPHFDVYYYPEEEAAARDAASMAERWYARLSRLLDYEFEERQPLILYASHPDFQQTTTYGGLISEGTGGFTEVFKQRVVMPFTYSYEETDHVLGHELVHAFQYDISGLGRAGGGLDEAARRYQVPLWFTEGMAEYLSVGPVDALTAMWVRDAVLQGEIPTIETMTYDQRIFPYRWGQALWAYIGGRWGDATIGQILKLAGDGVPYQDAFEGVLNISIEDLSRDWHARIRRDYLPLLTERMEPRELARPLITERTGGGRFNVAPAISPDGRYVAFVSERNFLDAELWLADGQTGQVIRRLQKGAAFDPHFGSLRYINSAGTWSPDGKYFAFSALREGRDVVVILNVATSKRLRELEAPGVREISNPNWSPDGRAIVFTGVHGGVSDLFLLEVQTGEITQLTDDAYAQLHPSFSPDGRTIAFVTDQGPETDLRRLVYGPYRLALFDVETRQTRLLSPMPGRKNINPVWTDDGSGLFFLSNRGGISDIYRLDVNTGELAQITKLFTGVSGITDVSPALTGARADKRIVFTVYERGGYNIYALSTPDELAGTPVENAPVAVADTAVPSFALLPPVPRPREATFNRVAAYLQDPGTGRSGKSDTLEYAVVPYRARLGLDYVGQPQVGASIGGPFGGSLYGGVAGIFSDVLGHHTVFGFLQATGQIDEIGFATQYIKSRERWSFGGYAQRIPYIYGYAQLGSAEVGGNEVYAYDLFRQRFFDTQLQGFALYPFSMQRRLELSGGFHRISNDYQRYRMLIDPASGQILDDTLEEIEGYGFNLYEASVALIYDNSLLGYTSPFAGQRYRFQISPTVGQLQFVQALADYRRYIFRNPFTLAIQGLHSGKYGRDAEKVVEVDGAGLQPIFYDQYLGDPSYVRGYYDSYGDCLDSGEPNGSACSALNSLFGSRIGVAKAELRFPLIQQLVLGGVAEFMPVEGIAFFDAGVAWGRETIPTREVGFLDDPTRRGILTSAGVGARINVLGYMILEVDYVNPFALKDGWKWEFNLIQGF